MGDVSSHAAELTSVYDSGYGQLKAASWLECFMFGFGSERREDVIGGSVPNRSCEAAPRIHLHPGNPIRKPEKETDLRPHAIRLLLWGFNDDVAIAPALPGLGA